MAKHTENAVIELAARPKALGDAWFWASEASGLEHLF